MMLLGLYVVCFVGLSYAQLNGTNYIMPQWQSGDVRLVNGTSPSNGVVQLYLDLKNGTAGWGTVCGKTATALSAATICKQLGYYVTNLHNPGRPTDRTNRNPVWLINDWDCNDIYSHILQCVNWTNINLNPFNPPLECSNFDMKIDCFDSSGPLTYAVNNTKDVQLYRNPGSTQVSSFGALRVYLSTASMQAFWGFVTNNIAKPNPFTMAAANAACRQLGYTGAVNYGKNMTFNPAEELTWFGGSKCTNQWYQCFSCCFDAPTTVCGDSCDVTTTVFLQCTFDLASVGANTKVTCSSETPQSCAAKSQDNATITALAVLLAFSWLIAIVLIAFHVYTKYKQPAVVQPDRDEHGEEDRLVRPVLAVAHVQPGRAEHGEQDPLVPPVPAAAQVLPQQGE